MIVGGAGVIGGLGLAGWAARELRGSLTPCPRPREGNQLVQTGAFSIVRHPIYAGGIAASVGWAILTWSGLGVALAGLLFLLFDAKSRREETWLAAVHPDYADYQRRTRRLVPGIY